MHINILSFSYFYNITFFAQWMDDEEILSPFDFTGFEHCNDNTASAQPVINGFNFDGFPKFDEDSLESSDGREGVKLSDTVNGDELYLQILEDLNANLTGATNATVYHYYQNFLESKPSHLRVPTMEDTLLKPCCGKYCALSFTLSVFTFFCQIFMRS